MQMMRRYAELKNLKEAKEKEAKAQAARKGAA